MILVISISRERIAHCIRYCLLHGLLGEPADLEIFTWTEGPSPFRSLGRTFPKTLPCMMHVSRACHML